MAVRKQLWWSDTPFFAYKNFKFRMPLKGTSRMADHGYNLGMLNNQLGCLNGQIGSFDGNSGSLNGQFNCSNSKFGGLNC